MELNSGLAFQGYFDKYYEGRHINFYNFLLGEVIGYSKPGPILDVGSGSGYFLQLCSEWGLAITGIEGSGEAITKMNARYPGLDIKHQLLSLRFPFEDDSFQTVVFNEVIEHLEPELQLHCLAEIFRVLKSEGTLIVHSPSRFNLRQKNEDPTHINLLSPSELTEMLREAGFVKLVDLNSPLYYLGKNRISKKIMDLLFRYFKIERFSATASYVAYKIK